MSWRDGNDAYEENPYSRLGRPGGDWQGLRPSFDNPISWALTIARVIGVRVRVHLFFLIFIIIMLARSAASDGIGIALMATLLAILFTIVLLHEFGHVIGCRYSGGSADEVLLWPLGGLAYVRPRHTWRSHMISTVSGPMVNVVICVVVGILLGVLTGQWIGVALPNPLYLFSEVGGPVINTWPLTILYLINGLSLILLLFNLLPIFPLDGGRIVQAALWPKFGYVRSMRYAVRSGYVGAIALLIFGAVVGHIMLVAIAIFGGITCFITHKQLQFTEEMAGFDSDEFAMSLAYGEEEPEEAARPTRSERKAQKQRQREQQEAAEVDRILKKIADAGMASLSRKEKNLLDRVSARKRGSRG